MLSKTSCCICKIPVVKTGAEKEGSDACKQSERRAEMVGNWKHGSHPSGAGGMLSVWVV